MSRNTVPKRIKFPDTVSNKQTKTTAKVPSQKENKSQYIEKGFLKTQNFQSSVVLLFFFFFFSFSFLCFSFGFVLVWLVGWLV